MITPEQLANESEDSQQLALMCWCGLNYNKYPELRRLAHIPNGGYRDKREGAKLKAMGVKPGFPDLFLPITRLPFAGLFIEMKTIKFKTKKGGGLSEEQNDWLPFLRTQRFGTMVCYGWIEARDTLINYLEWKG